LPLLRKLGIGFVPYSPLGRGFLSGELKTIDDLAPDDRRRMFPRFQGDNFAKNLVVVERVSAIAKQKQVTPAQLALAWVLAQGDDLVPIPGTKRLRYLEENLAASKVELNAEELASLDQASPKGSAVGNRYADMSSINR
jgi:aryl-alcohol dehydrogenase-like predicted oxidoreductase